MIGIFDGVANHLWQSTVFAAAAALLARVFRKNRAHVRYWIWLSASLKFLVPLSLFLMLGRDLANSLTTGKAVNALATPSVAITADQITQPFSETMRFRPIAPQHSTNWLVAAALVIWACGFLAIVITRTRAWLRVRALLKASTAVEIAAGVNVRTSPGLLEPGVVGIWRPALLLPDGISERLRPSQLEAVLRHELSHIRRRDNLTAALHMVVEAVFWLHPAIWWIGARLLEERERACDEAVLAFGTVARDYAEAILGVCKSYVESPLACVAGVTGADLKRRIQAILSDAIGVELTRSKKIALTIAAIVAASLPVVLGILIAPQLRAQMPDGPLPSFEVASIKPDPDPGHRGGHSIHIHENNGYYSATGLTAKYLIKDAYNLNSDDQLSGGSDWISSDAYAIDAKLDPAVEKKWTYREKRVQMRLVIQSLLADRFKLKVSHQAKELPVFDLVVAKGGPKMGAPTGDDQHQGDDGHNEGNVEIEKFKNEPVASLVEELGRQPEIGGHLVVDKTGLVGDYTFDFKWTRQTDSSDPASNTSVSSDPPSLWTALQEQLGLKLQSDKGPVDCIVIDSIEKPTPN
jgi:bla regulator protein BlaR1